MKEIVLNGCTIQVSSDWNGCDKIERVLINAPSENFSEEEAVVICSYLYDEGFISQDEVALEVHCEPPIS